MPTSSRGVQPSARPQKPCRQASSRASRPEQSKLLANTGPVLVPKAPARTTRPGSFSPIWRQATEADRSVKVRLAPRKLQICVRAWVLDPGKMPGKRRAQLSLSSLKAACPTHSTQVVASLSLQSFANHSPIPTAAQPPAVPGGPTSVPCRPQGAAGLQGRVGNVQRVAASDDNWLCWQRLSTAPASAWTATAEPAGHLQTAIEQQQAGWTHLLGGALQTKPTSWAWPHAAVLRENWQSLSP